MTDVSPASPHENECPAALAIGLAKAVVTAARREDRWPLWQALSEGIEDAKQDAQRSGDAMPWDLPEDVQVVPWSSVQRTLRDALGTLEEPEERVRLVRVARDAHDKLTAAGTGKALKPSKFGIKRCAWCSKPFSARNHTHAYCCGAHRVAAYEARQRANGQAGENVSTGQEEPSRVVSGA